MNERDFNGENAESFSAGNQGFAEFYDELKSMYPDEDQYLDVDNTEIAKTIKKLTKTNFRPLFDLVSLRSPETQVQFYTAFFEGLGYRDTAALGKAIIRLRRIPWFIPQPGLKIDELRENATQAHKAFSSRRHEPSQPELIVTTDFTNALEVQEMFERRDPNSYHRSYDYKDRLLDHMSATKYKQGRKHQSQLGDDWIAMPHEPQWFVSWGIYKTAQDGAKKTIARTNFNLAGTGEEIKSRFEMMSRVLTSNVSIITNGYLASADVGVEPNPFEPLIQMYEVGVVPLGGSENEFYVFISNMPDLEMNAEISASAHPQLP